MQAKQSSKPLFAENKIADAMEKGGRDKGAKAKASIALAKRTKAGVIHNALRSRRANRHSRKSNARKIAVNLNGRKLVKRAKQKS